jgi:hypothetical protein
MAPHEAQLTQAGRREEDAGRPEYELRARQARLVADARRPLIEVRGVVTEPPPALRRYAAAFAADPVGTELLAKGWRVGLVDLRRVCAVQPIVFTDAEGGGRVNHLTARPALELFYPELAQIRQPLAGEVAARRELVNGAKNYFEYKERCVFCDMIKQELSTGQRVVAENDDFVAFVPFAARFPFEVHPITLPIATYLAIGP